MAGEAWLQKFQMGKEVTAGTPVVASRIIYANGSIQPNYNVNVVHVSTGTRDMQRDAHIRAVQVAGQLTHPFSADEIIEYLLLGIKGGVTPVAQTSPTPTVDPTLTNATSGGTIAAGVITGRYTVVTPAGESQPKTVTATTTTTTGASTVTFGAVTPLPSGATAVRYYITLPGGAAATATYAGTNATGAAFTATAPGDGTTLPPSATPTAVQTWTFTPGTALDSATLEYNDGARNWQAAGVRVDTLQIQGSVGADNTITAGLFGTAQVVNAATGALSSRTPLYFEGWEAKLYLDAFGATPGTTVAGGLMTSWNIQIGNGLGRKYTADNTTAANSVTIGELSIKAEITMEAANVQALTEFNNYVGATKRLARFEFGNNIAVGTGAAKKKVTLDVPGVWQAFDLTTVDANTRQYKFTMEYITDTTNGWPLQIAVVSDRATAY